MKTEEDQTKKTDETRKRRNMISGSLTALVTPFKDGKVDADAYQAFVDWQITMGTNGLVPCGTTGEASTLTRKEHVHVVELCVQAAAGRVPVIAGIGSNNTDTAIHTAIAVQEAGFMAVFFKLAGKLFSTTLGCRKDNDLVHLWLTNDFV